MVTWENYEEYLMLHIDGELTPGQEEELFSFVKQHPDLQKELQLYSSARLVPDTDAQYEFKDQLLKPAAGKKIIALTHWRRYAAAAGVALLIATTAGIWQGRRNRGVEVTHVSVPVRQKELVPASVSSPGTRPGAGKDTAIAAVAQQGAATANPGGAHTFSLARRRGSNPAKRQGEPVAACGMQHTRPGNDLASIVPVAAKAFPAAGKDIAPANVATVAVPQYSASVASSRLHNLWSKVPLNKRNKQQMENLAGLVVAAVDNIGEAGRVVEQKAVNVTVENKQLVLSIN